MQPEELQYLDDLVSPRLLNSQSVHVVFATSKDKLPCCERTLYNYVDKCLLTARNLDMPRRVRFKARYKHKARTASDAEFAKGRTYKDFQAYMEKNPDVQVCEMDTVIGRPGGKALLTLIFRSCNLMIAVLLERDTQDCVIEALISPFDFIVNMSIPYLIVSILIVTRACSKMPELQCYRCSRSQLRCQNYILALSRCSSNPNAYVPIHASMIVSYTLEFSSLLAQKKVPDKGPDRLYRNPLIVRLISLRLAPSSKGVAGLHRSYVSPPLLIRDIKYSINITA